MPGRTHAVSGTAELDQLLSGMLLDVQNIPDIRASQTRNLHSDIDVDSIQVNFDTLPPHKNDTTVKNYIYESDTVRRVATTPKNHATTAPEDIPYHAREDSKPFTYGIVGSGSGISATSSPLPQRSGIKGSTSPRGLQSPQLVRKFVSGSAVATPQLVRKFSDGVAGSTPRHTPLKYSASLPFSYTPNALPIATSSPQPSETPSTSEEAVPDDSSSSFDNKWDGDAGSSSWLQRQKQKLRDRKDSFLQTERRAKETQLLRELRATANRPGDDGYLSDATLNTSREATPDSCDGIYATPLHINTSSTKTNRLERQKSDATYERTTNALRGPYAAYRATAPTAANESSSGLLTTVADEHSTKEDSMTSWSSSVSADDNLGVQRPTTPGFPVVPRTPYLNARHFSFNSPGAMPSSISALPPTSPTLHRKERSPSPSSTSMYMSQSRRSSVSGSSEPHDVSSNHVNFVKDNLNLWYKPNISREETINLLKDKPPGTFIVRDSNSFPGAFGLALKVATPPPQTANRNSVDPAVELVRHFLIEPTSKGVRIKGCPNEPVFGSLSALVYQHSVTPLALPCALILPEHEISYDTVDASVSNPVAKLLTQGASCNVVYLFTMDTESLTGPQAVYRTLTHLLQCRPSPVAVTVHFKVSAQGITLTDSERKLFFRRHYPTNAISYCGLDPEDRRWNEKAEDSALPLLSRRCFGFVARKPASKTDNQCHIFAELEPEQPASAIVSFVTKVLMNSTTHKSNI